MHLTYAVLQTVAVQKTRKFSICLQHASNEHLVNESLG